MVWELLQYRLGKALSMDSMAMKVQPVKRIAHTHEKDERRAAEERHIELLLNLISGMNIPQSRLQFLRLKTQRRNTLEWLHNNLSIYNSHHKNHKRAHNIINLILQSPGDT